jgi:signal transduction histidine kinase
MTYISEQLKGGLDLFFSRLKERFRLSILLRLNIMYFKRLLSIFISVNILIIFISFGFIIFNNHSYLRDTLSDYSRFIEENSAELSTPNSVLNKKLSDELNYINKDADNYVKITDSTGAEIYSSPRKVVGDTYSSPVKFHGFGLQLIKTKDENSINIPGKNNFTINMTVERDFMSSDFLDVIDSNGVDKLRVGMSYNLSSDIKSMGNFLICFSLFILVVEFVIIIRNIGKSSLKIKKILSPIQTMNKIINAISITNIDTRLNIEGSQNELKDLANTFNKMLDRIQNSYEAQNQFVSDASHELRTPLAVIQGYSKMLNRWGKSDQAVLDESLIAIESESENMKSLIEQLLFLARGDKNTQSFNREDFELSDFMDNLIKESILIDEHKHNIILDRNDQMIINADKGLIRQCVRIFIDNSIKYTADGGDILVSSYIAGSDVTIVIKDSGIGISKADLPKVFDRFFRADRSRTRETGGTGLGLSIANWIVLKHGGTIDVTSQLDKGTTFMIKLPQKR